MFTMRDRGLTQGVAAMFGTQNVEFESDLPYY